MKKVNRDPFSNGSEHMMFYVVAENMVEYNPKSK